MGLALGLAWASLVGIAYRQRSIRALPGTAASLIFYGSFIALFAWQVNEHVQDDLAALETPLSIQFVQADDWWEEDWQQMPENRTEVISHSASLPGMHRSLPQSRWAPFQEHPGQSALRPRTG